MRGRSHMRGHVCVYTEQARLLMNALSTGWTQCDEGWRQASS